MTASEFSDGFNAGTIDPTKWRDRQIEPHQISFSDDAREGEKAVVITTTKDDGGSLPGEKPYQRAELRIHGNRRPTYGEEIWYGFSFKVTGDIPSVGSTRTVIGQWKAPGDDSPFLAQRFDNGVFHITIQDGPNRIAVASAEGDPDRLFEFQDVVADLSADPALGPAAVRAARSLAHLKAFARHAGPAPALAERLHHLDSLKAASEAVGHIATDHIEDLFEEFEFIQEIEAYSGKSPVKIERPAPKKLPDPKADWVDMTYRIRGGRTDNVYGPNTEGEIDIWANGELIAEVRGNVGYPLLEPQNHMTMYFKFGMYRDPLPGTIHFHFDNFRQGTSRMDV